MDSVGDAIRPGRYKVAHVFQRSVLLFRYRQPLFVVARSIGAGPLNVVCGEWAAEPLFHSVEKLADGSMRFFHSVEKFKGRAGRFFHTVEKSSFAVYDSAMPEWNPAWNNKWAAALAEWLELHSRGSFSRWVVGGGAVRRGDVAARYFFHAVELLENPQTMLEGVRLMRGFGEGMTPSGDDFLGGWMVAQRMLGRADEIPRVLRRALGGNAVSNAFLRLAAAGRVHAAMKVLLGTRPESKRFSRRVFDVCQFGHSSGADLLAGVLAGLRSGGV